MNTSSGQANPEVPSVLDLSPFYPSIRRCNNKCDSLLTPTVSCPKCESAFYCSQACRIAHLPIHEQACKRILENKDMFDDIRVHREEARKRLERNPLPPDPFPNYISCNSKYGYTGEARVHPWTPPSFPEIGETGFIEETPADGIIDSFYKVLGEHKQGKNHL